MIQDNLIKFSTFLQQQEMRQRKDLELTAIEKKKIEQLEEEFREKEALNQMYAKKQERIDRKVKIMKKYDEFLERVKDAN